LARVARRFAESAASSKREQQLEFVALCKAITEAVATMSNREDR
jgi:hypothetical protein